MRVDLLAGTVYGPAAMPSPAPTILVFDSGLGGLTVFAELRRARPDGHFVYAADDAGFPYGRLSETELEARVLAVMENLIARYAPDLVVIACNTASTVVLPPLRRRFPIPFVGTVPAVKPACLLSNTKRISVLATPGTVARDYTRGLIESYAGACRVTLVGSQRLAAFGEQELTDSPAGDAEILAELRPCFVEDEGGRTDVIVLACTHYPLLLRRFETLAPWPVAFIDPAPAVARRVVQLLGEAPSRPIASDDALAVFTDGRAIGSDLRRALASRGLTEIAAEPMPLRPAVALT